LCEITKKSAEFAESNKSTDFDAIVVDAAAAALNKHCLEVCFVVDQLDKHYDLL
jgi:hypothetical protein